MWGILLDWLLILLGFLWVKRFSRRRLWCNFYSAAVAAVLFLSVEHGLQSFLHSGAHLLLGKPRIIHLLLSFSIVPAASALTLFLGNALIPAFEVEKKNLLRCTVYLIGWTFISYILSYLIKQWALLLLAGISGSGMPRVRSRWFDGEIRY